jgi:predicted nucleic acid-binding protein
MARVFVDTSGIYALIDRDDANHGAARAALDRMRTRRDEPVITNFIMAECHALLLARLGSEVARKWLSTSVWAVERVTPEDEEAARAIIYAHVDKRCSFTDATSFSAMKRLRIRSAVAYDRHFAQFGIKLE